MRPVPIVALDEGRQGLGPLALAPPCPGVLPLLRDRPVHPLDPAVLPRAERPRVDVAGPGGPEQLVELSAAVPRSVVRHDSLDGDAEAGLYARDQRLAPPRGHSLALGRRSMGGLLLPRFLATHNMREPSLFVTDG